MTAESGQWPPAILRDGRVDPTPYEEVTMDNDSSLYGQTPEAAPWRLVVAIIVLVLAMLGGVAAAVFQPEPTTVTCVVTTSGQSLCPEPVKV